MVHVYPVTAILIALATLTGGCLERVDGSDYLAQVKESAAKQRFAELYGSPTCQQQFSADDVQCWEEQRDGDVAVQTGISRTLHGYIIHPYTVQTHLKVRIYTSYDQYDEVYYFADAGEGGLEMTEGWGVADGAINVYCTTDRKRLWDMAIINNSSVTQQQVDSAAECVHQAVLQSEHFGQQVKRCLDGFRSHPEQRVAMVDRSEEDRAPRATAREED